MRNLAGLLQQAEDLINRGENSEALGVIAQALRLAQTPSIAEQKAAPTAQCAGVQLKRSPVLHYSGVKAGWSWCSLTLDDGEVLEVLGDPDNACYEWLLRSGDTLLRHSDCGYGIPGVALRNGLLAFYRKPTSTPIIVNLRPKQLAGVP